MKTGYIFAMILTAVLQSFSNETQETIPEGRTYKETVISKDARDLVLEVNDAAPLFMRDSISIKLSCFYHNNAAVESRDKIRDILKSNASALEKYNRGIRISQTAYVFTSIGGSLLGLGLASRLIKDENIQEATPYLIGIGGGFASVGIGVSFGAKGLYVKARDIYNSREVFAGKLQSTYHHQK
jgi:hypothetical protein